MYNIQFFHSQRRTSRKTFEKPNLPRLAITIRFQKNEKCRCSSLPARRVLWRCCPRWRGNHSNRHFHTKFLQIVAELYHTNVTVKWHTDYERQLVDFSIWFGASTPDVLFLGFSDFGDTNNSDVLMYYNSKKEIKVENQRIL